MPILLRQARAMKDDTLVNRLVALCKQKGSESDINILTAELKRRLAESKRSEQPTLPNYSTNRDGGLY